jgi:hypothetical protein
VKIEVNVDKLDRQQRNVSVQLASLAPRVNYVRLLDPTMAFVRVEPRLLVLGDTCTTFPCKNGGGCTPLLAETGTKWSAYRCVCPVGIYGQHCDTSKNDSSLLIDRSSV